MHSRCSKCATASTRGQTPELPKRRALCDSGDGCSSLLSELGCLTFNYSLRGDGVRGGEEEGFWGGGVRWRTREKRATLLEEVHPLINT